MVLDAQTILIILSVPIIILSITYIVLLARYYSKTLNEE